MNFEIDENSLYCYNNKIKLNIQLYISQLINTKQSNLDFHFLFCILFFILCNVGSVVQQAR